MLKLITKLNKELGTTIIFSTHQLHEVQEIANRLLIIDKGVSVSEGNVDDFMRSVDFSYHLTLSNLTAASGVLDKLNVAHQIHNDVFKLKCSEQELNKIMMGLVENNIEFHKIESKHSLEDYFLSNVS